MGRFELVTQVAAPPERVFDLSLEVDLHTSSMSRFGEQVVGGVTRGRLGPGDTVTWRARHFGVRWRLTSRITEHRRPAFFVDEQVTGPFRMWRHEHYFEADGDGGTVMTDRVEFVAPFGILGTTVDRLFLARYMERLIRSRNAAILDRA